MTKVVDTFPTILLLISSIILITFNDACQTNACKNFYLLVCSYQNCRSSVIDYTSVNFSKELLRSIAHNTPPPTPYYTFSNHSDITKINTLYIQFTNPTLSPAHPHTHTQKCTRNLFLRWARDDELVLFRVVVSYHFLHSSIRLHHIGLGNTCTCIHT